MEPTTIELERYTASITRDAKRAKVVNYIVRELAELDGKEDGFFLHELFEEIKCELSALMMVDKSDPEVVRNLSMCMAKVDEARGWALRYSEGKKHIWVLDRRRFREDDDNDSE